MSQKSNIDKLKKKIEELEKSVETYRVLADNNPDLLYRTDHEGRIIYISQSVYRLSGYSVEEAIGMKMAEEVYLIPEEREVFLEELQEKGRVFNFKAQLKRKDGSIWWASTNAHYYQDKDGNVLGVEGIARDITSLKVSEEALKESEQRYRTLFESSIDALAIIDAKTGKFIDCNGATIKLFEIRSRENFIGLTIGQLSPDFQPSGEASSSLAEKHIRQTLKEGSKVFEWISVKKDGTLFPALVTLCAMKIGPNKMILSVGRDLTEIKKGEEKKEKLIRELKDALSEVKILSGLLPICSSCKKIRDDQGYWNQIENYIRDHSDADFSHSMCPDCAEEYYPGLNFYRNDQE